MAGPVPAMIGDRVRFGRGTSEGRMLKQKSLAPNAGNIINTW
jgi:hypothetical protein